MLQEILKNYFGVSGEVFNAAGELTEEGSRAYDNLLALLNELYQLGAFTRDHLERIVKYLDGIVSGEVF